jgi:Rieske Fe-S protein
MARCDACGNDYDKPMYVRQGPREGTFDCFECAIHAMAPACAHCGCRIIGHGAETASAFYCCAHCAAQEGVRGLDDRV